MIDMYHETNVCFDVVVGYFPMRKSY